MKKNTAEVWSQRAVCTCILELDSYTEYNNIISPIVNIYYIYIFIGAIPFLEGHVYRKKMFAICTYYSLNHSLYDVFENNKTLRQGNDYFSPLCLLLFNQTFFCSIPIERIFMSVISLLLFIV